MKKAFQSKNINQISQNKIFIYLTMLYIIILLFISSIACFFAYNQRREELLLEMDMTFIQLKQDYQDTIDNFYQIYMPIYESNNSINPILKNYFISSSQNNLKPLEKLELKKALSQMMTRDSQVQWIAVYSEEHSVNYILYGNSGSLQELPQDFPYYDELHSKSNRMEIYGMQHLSDFSRTVSTYAICGDVPSSLGEGKIIAGYSISSLEQIYKNSSFHLESLNYVLFSGNSIVFDSRGIYSKEGLYQPIGNQQGIFETSNKKKLYVNSTTCGNKTSNLSYTASYSEIFVYSHKYTPLILLIVLGFAGFSIIIYTIMLQMLSKEVFIIQKGLKYIGENQLDYQLPTKFKQSGLSEIAEAVNRMTIRLNENIKRAYYYEIKQKDAELSELQSKFNPHFLYNSLEMLRSRCYQSGDTQTAELITQLAAIFRGFISSKTFIPMSDELAFSKRYLSLFGARYGDRVKIRYDIDTDVLKYGIIRNVFQPLIENYFVHGLDSTEEDNYILFRGKSFNDRMILLTVEDNGSGMSDEEIIELNNRLHKPVKLDTESYGLKNLHQRLQLFYGEECGLYITRNGKKGLSIQMTVLKIICE